SPFTDLRNDLPYFNAVILCTTRGIMVAKDLISGEFDAMGDVSGAEALLSLRVLRTQLEKY
ncbi:MAG: S-layer homology domain-containing protein, partial [Proteobacteria bacterium]|nr:S-layer homology domain-containing protein [Pseudomonadota bacterium]